MEINKIFSFLDKPRSVYVIGTDLRQQIVDTIGLIEKNEEKCYKCVFDSLNGLRNVLIQSEVNEEFKDFLRDYASFVLHLNDTRINIDDVKNFCYYLIRFSNDELNVHEFFNYFSEVTIFLINSINIEQNMFKLSDHYFNILEE